MSDKENESVEKDAMALEEITGKIVRRSTDTNLMPSSGNQNLISNQLVSTSNTVAVNYSFQGSTGVHIGNNYHLSWTPGSSRPASVPSVDQRAEEENIYKKTRSISELMKSTDRLTEQYLDIFSEFFGDFYEQLPILLNIDDLFFKRMHVDYFQSGRSREVIYQTLYHYFQEHQEIATVGWFTKFLWQNKFRKTVHAVKDRLKQLKELEREDMPEGDDEVEESYL